MNNSVKINLNNRTKHQINLNGLQQAASSILHDIQLGGIVEIDLTICGRLFMQKNNLRYRNINRPTDVLSFPINQFYRGKATKAAFPNFPDIPTHLGDIMICYDIAKLQAKQHNKTEDEEIEFLFTHGLKHLLGFHHK